jgi:MOSC domain-containing protein YiiM
VVTPGRVSSGDAVTVVRRPEHDVTVSLLFRALTLERGLAPQLLRARDDLTPEARHALGIE